MTIDESLEAFKKLSEEDVLNAMLLDRDPVYQLSYMANYLLRVEGWAKAASDALAVTPQPEFAAAVASARKLVNETLPRVSRMLANAVEKRAGTHSAGSVITPMSDDADPATSCIDRQQDINREALSSLSEADSWGERADAIIDWGDDTRDNLGQCLDDAFGQFDDANDGSE